MPKRYSGLDSRIGTFTKSARSPNKPPSARQLDRLRLRNTIKRLQKKISKRYQQVMISLPSGRVCYCGRCGCQFKFSRYSPRFRCNDCGKKPHYPDHRFCCRCGKLISSVQLLEITDYHFNQEKEKTRGILFRLFSLAYSADEQNDFAKLVREEEITTKDIGSGMMPVFSVYSFIKQFSTFDDFLSANIKARDDFGKRHGFPTAPRRIYHNNIRNCLTCHKASFKYSTPPGLKEALRGDEKYQQLKESLKQVRGQLKAL